MKINHSGLVRISISATGLTNPKIPTGTEIIMVQEGIVQVGRLHFVEGDISSLEILHPINASNLNHIARMIVGENDPESLKSENSIIILCPKDLALKMIWD